MHRHAVATPRHPLPTRLVQPGAQIAREDGVEPFAEQRGQTGGRTARRDRERDAVATDDAAQKRGGVCGIVDRVDEHPSHLGNRGDLAIRFGCRRSHDKPHAVEIRRLECATLNRDTGSLNLLAHINGDDPDVGAGGQKLTELASRHSARSHEQDTAAREVNKKRQEL